MAERVLKDHGDTPAVNLAARFNRHCQKVLTVEQYLAAADMPGRHVDKVHDGRR
ncbi:hypothetical protein D3C78_806310 [compost metagenome]